MMAKTTAGSFPYKHNIISNFSSSSMALIKRHRYWYHVAVLSTAYILCCAHAFTNVNTFQPCTSQQRNTISTAVTIVWSSSSRSNHPSAEPSDSDDANYEKPLDTWEDHFKLFCNITIETGQSIVPLDHPLLGNWIRNQRVHYKQYQKVDGDEHDNKSKVLTPHRLRLLKLAGFVFDVADYEWMQNYRQLQTFHAVHGHCRVSSSSTTKVPYRLCRWVNTQRSNYHKGIMKTARIELLSAIDFGWESPHEWAYRENTKQVAASNRSIWDFKTTDGPLGLWMSRQRTQYRKYCNDDDDCLLQEYQIELLETELGLNCQAVQDAGLPRAPLDIEWADRMRQLEEFQAEHGHLNVPRTFTKHKNLGAWVSKVRERYRFHGAHSSERIQSRLEDLFAIGFIWDVCEYKWQNQFARLIDFYEQHGHVHVPDSLPGIGPWVKEQRREYHKFRRGEPSRLTPKHAMALNRIGLDWNRQESVRRKQDSTFQKRVDEYVQHMQENPNASTASMPKQLQNWVERQRKVYRKWLQGENDMMEERRNTLENIGVVEGITENVRK